MSISLTNSSEIVADSVSIIEGNTIVNIKDLFALKCDANTLSSTYTKKKMIIN